MSKQRPAMKLPTNEGTIFVSFVFDGITYTNRHQLTASEMRHMKDLCRSHGDTAADQMIWKVAIRGTGMVAENIMAKAALAYIKKHYKGPAIIVDTTNTVDANEKLHPTYKAEDGKLEVAVNDLPMETENEPK